MPLISQVRVDRLLTNIAIAFRSPRHIADRLLPPVRVQNEVDIYWKYDFSNFNVPEGKRAPRANYKEIDWSASTDTYRAEEYGLEQPIDDRERRNQSAPMNIDRRSTTVLTQNLLNMREKRVSTLLLATANYPAGHSITLLGGAKWSDPVNSDPMGDIADGRVKIQSATGYLPNKLAIGYNVLEALMVHEQIRDYLAAGGLVTEEVLARLFRVDEVIVGSVLTNTAKQGQTVALGDLWANDAILFYQEAGEPALETPSFGYQMLVQDLQMETYRDIKRKSDVIRGTEIRGEKLTANQLGYVIKGAA